jgi:hypothetical protein
VLWKASGTKSTYDPPASEWAYLGVEQEIYIGKPPVERRRKTARPSRAEGLSGESKAMAGISFNKQPINKTSTMSQLTKGIELGMLAIPSMAKIYGLEGYKPDDLPSTFDDSDDDDEFWERDERQKESGDGDMEGPSSSWWDIITNVTFQTRHSAEGQNAGMRRRDLRLKRWSAERPELGLFVNDEHTFF